MFPKNTPSPFPDSSEVVRSGATERREEPDWGSGSPQDPGAAWRHRAEEFRSSAKINKRAIVLFSTSRPSPRFSCKNRGLLFVWREEEDETSLRSLHLLLFFVSAGLCLSPPPPCRCECVSSYCLFTCVFPEWLFSLVEMIPSKQDPEERGKYGGPGSSTHCKFRKRGWFSEKRFSDFRFYRLQICYVRVSLSAGSLTFFCQNKQLWKVFLQLWRCRNQCPQLKSWRLKVNHIIY